MSRRTRFFLTGLLAAGAIAGAESFPVDLRPEGMRGMRVGSIEILDQRELVYPEIDGQHFSEISDLAYREGSGDLFMVSDEGKLFRFRARFGEKIRELKPREGSSLRDKKGKKLSKKSRDVEGMALGPKGRLHLSFEGKPRVVRVSDDGRIRKKLSLPEALARRKNYLRPNKGLEALIHHPRYGWVTAPERPLKKAPRVYHTLYTLSGTEWRYRRGKDLHSCITALEVLENGNFLVLERSFVSVLDPFVVTLKEVQIDRCTPTGLCPARILARLDTSRGWRVENFEGLTRVGPDRFVMISDDGDKLYARTVMLYFRVLSSSR